jgi:hypothetical protein
MINEWKVAYYILIISWNKSLSSYFDSNYVISKFLKIIYEYQKIGYYSLIMGYVYFIITFYKMVGIDVSQ